MVAPEMDRLYRQYLAEDWVERHDDPGLWERVAAIPDEALWDARGALKRRLLRFL